MLPAMNKISIAILGQLTTIRQLSDCLQSHPELELSVSTTDPTVLIQGINQFNPQVVLLEVAPTCTKIPECIHQIQAHQPETKCIILAHQLNVVHVRQTILAGATGYLLISPNLDDLAISIRLVHSGKFICSATIATLLTSPG
jgi:DNA-binding NarL/FixJ family response regulator